MIVFCQFHIANYIAGVKDGCDELLSVSLDSEAIDSDDSELSELEDPLYKEHVVHT